MIFMSSLFDDLKEGLEEGCFIFLHQERMRNI